MMAEGGGGTPLSKGAPRPYNNPKQGAKSPGRFGAFVPQQQFGQPIKMTFRCPPVSCVRINQAPKLWGLTYMTDGQ